MPLFEYVCKTCGFEFEELRKASDTVPCLKCKSVTEKKVSRVASVVSGGSPTESVDMTIGREAAKRWEGYEQRQSKRRGNKELKPVSLPKTKDGKFMPVMGLGGKAERSKRTEYSSALQDHREQREKKGQGQFEGIGL